MITRSADLTLSCICAQAIPGIVWSAETRTWRLLGGCEMVDALPPLGFVLGGQNFTLGPRQYIIQARPPGFLMQHAQIRPSALLMRKAASKGF